MIVHVISGFSGLALGTINIIRKKGGKKHRQIGRLFVFFMLSTGISSLILALIHPNVFLFIIGVLTVYLVGTGDRYMRLRLLGKGQKPAFIDWFLTLGMLLSGCYFIGKGSYLIYYSKQVGIIMLVFGLIGLINVRMDFRNYLGNQKKTNYWMLIHIGRMMGSYISALTAFIVVNTQNFPFEVPQLIIWLGPTFLLVPLSIYWSKPYK